MFNSDKARHSYLKAFGNTSLTGFFKPFSLSETTTDSYDVTVKVAEASVGGPIGKSASIEYVPGGADGTIRVLEKVPVDDAVRD